MEHFLNHFPVFEANQILMSGHLNDVFDFLDQQNRRTRSHLVGIGIVCGLEVELDGAGAMVSLSSGCGVTSEGYLIVEPEDVGLVAFRKYVLPDDLEYPPLKDIDLWELFPAGEPGTTPLPGPAGFLDEKAVVLLLEMRRQGLRNCSPNSCDDKGSEVTATVRRLVIGAADLDAVIAAAHDLGEGLTATDIAEALTARLNLPDLRARRFDVTSTNPSTSADVYAAFLAAFHADGLSKATADALVAAYDTFRPLVAADYPTNPFAGFGAAYGFLDGAPQGPEQVRFLQYYADLFDDLLRAYDEFRWAAAELVCLCCPPAGLFPRHLMLGDLRPSADQPGRRRHAFIPSPALGRCADRSKEVVQLFERLVEMTRSFTNAPSLPAPGRGVVDPQIRITPSRIGDVALGARAIPYYYEQTGVRPLYRVWNPERTRRRRAHQNLGYRAEEFAPAAPAWAKEPLAYDLEPYDFLRVEGHLGKPVGTVLGTLLELKARNRLPVDFVALRTGAYDDRQPVDVGRERARFQDLEALFDALREQLLAALAEGAREIYDIVIPDSRLPGGTPHNPLLQSHAAGFRFAPGTIGAWFEQNLARFLGMSYVEVDQNNIDPNAVVMIYCVLFGGTSGLPDANRPHVVSLYYFLKLSQILPDSLDALAYGDFENKCQDLLGLVRYFRTEAARSVSTDLQAFLPQDEIMDLCEQVLFNCQIDPMRSVHEEYVWRVGELRRRQFLSTFLRQHPGVQHKAGAPVGGPFVLVYHGDEPERRFTPVRDLTLVAATGAVRPADRLVIDAISRIGSDARLALNADVGLILNAFRAVVPEIGDLRAPAALDDAAAKVIAAAVAELAPGAVIADFYLPYRLCVDGPVIQYVLPRPRPSFTVRIGCANADGLAMVEVSPSGGGEPYDLAVDKSGYQALDGPLMLASGGHVLTLRDAEGTESVARAITVPQPIRLSEPAFDCEDGRFVATMTITGGVGPYSVDGREIDGAEFTTQPTASGERVSVEVLDARGCSLETAFTHECPQPCNLPCEGIAVRRGHRFWLPDPDPRRPYRAFSVDGVVFGVQTTDGRMIDLSDKVAAIVVAGPDELADGKFPETVRGWIDRINETIAGVPELNDGSAQWLTLAWDPGQPGRFGTLWIEHFDCLGFEIVFPMEISGEGFGHRLEIAYAAEGDSLRIDDDPVVKAPPYDGERFDKCDPETPGAPFCPRRPGFALRIVHELEGMVLSASAVVLPATEDLRFFWEARGGRPAFGDDTKLQTAFETSDVYEILLTAYTPDGCRVERLLQVNVG
jgi:hypothetical protein